MENRTTATSIRRCSRLSWQGGLALLPLLVTVLLAGVLLVRLGLGGKHIFMPAHNVPGNPMAAISEGASRSRVDLEAIQAMRLFQAESNQAAITVANRSTAPVPAAQGNLRLEGVVLAGTPEHSVAFIRSGGRQQAYRVGDQLEGGALTLEVVARNHVIFDRRGESVQLSLHEAGADQAAQGATPAGILSGLAQGLPSINQANLSQALQAVDEAMSLASLAEVIEVRPAQRNGRLIGYQLSPGVRLKEFVQLGLRTGDIVTAVNGIPLDDMAALQSLGDLMNGATEVSFSLLRDGQVQNLRISLQALADSSRPSTNNTNNVESP